MVDVIYNAKDVPLPVEQHVTVVVHKELVNGRAIDKAYFYDSSKGDYGGSGPFDFLVDEAIERAKRFASDNNITKVVMRAQQP
ncbi:hypothetical protein [Pleomorphomonas carboxyditropha]|uniref:hypothetical protein n=1 Tax=Pleomorphomonas carboxyditropha TaxID=2023338 RepID=UPI0010544739|nr:hypothetical protein [Pleomorphomonas carboxyditropha]